jgi:hypothetical protein
MIEALKALIENLRLNHEYCPKEVILQAADELERLAQRTEPQIKTTDPFESARVADYNRGWNDCLFASGIVKQSQRTEERNFCPRCGKRLGGVDDIHTCTAPKEQA